MAGLYERQPRWTLRCEKCGAQYMGLETWQVDGEATQHTCTETIAQPSVKKPESN